MRKKRVKSAIAGSDRPRLSVHISNKNIIAQIIDDANHKTLAYVTTNGKNAIAGTMTQKAQWVGEEIAKQAVAVKIKKIVFDRNGALYHGRIKTLAESARNAGLEF